MKNLLQNNPKRTPILIFWGLLAALFTLKLVFFTSELLLVSFLFDLLLLFTLAFLTLHIVYSLDKKNPSPLSLTMNIGILSVIVFFIITFSDVLMTGLFDNVNEKFKSPTIVYTVVTLFYVLLFIGFFAYLLAAFRELFFLRRGRRLQLYFFTMLGFFVLTSLATFLPDDMDYVRKTFYIISSFLILVNSVRISWIAFISKREKITLLLLSIALAVLFVVNLSNHGDPNIHQQMMAGFSESFHQFASLMFLYGAIYFGILFFTTLFHIPTAEAYDRKAKEVSSLQFFSKLITEVLDFNDLANTVTDISIQVSSADAAWIIWTESDEFQILANKNIALVDAEMITRSFTSTTEYNKINETIIYGLTDSFLKSELSENFSSLVISPVRTHNKLNGFLVAAKKNELIFYEEDKRAIDTFSDYASVAIENSRLLEASIEKERLQKELDVAREIQKKILPSRDPQFKKLAVSSVFIPAYEVGGDYYDFFEIEDDKLGFVIADVSGKGISAAFIMAEIKGIFKSLSRTIGSPKAILIKSNQILRETLDRKTFVSAAYGIIDMKNNSVKIARAGHCPVLLIRDGIADNLRPKGMGLGLSSSNLFDITLEEFSLELKDDDLLVLYTDGITESKNKQLDEFGEEQFSKILVENANKHVDDISREVIEQVSNFSKDFSQYDDITLVIFKWNNKSVTQGDKEWQSSIQALKN